MNSDERQDKTPQQSAIERLAETARTASPEEYRQIEERIFNDYDDGSNDPLQAGRTASMWLDAGRKMRSGARPEDAITDAVVSHPEFRYREFPPPWKGTDFGGPLTKVKIRRNLKKPFPATKAGHIQFWDGLWSGLHSIVREAYGLSAHKADLWLKATPEGRKKILEEARKPTRLSPSKEAEIYRRAANQLQRLSKTLEPFMSRRFLLQRVVSEWRCQSEALTELSRCLPESATGKGHHSVHPETQLIRELMELIHHETGRWHDKELATLLNLAGLNQITPKSLADYRRHAK